MTKGRGRREGRKVMKEEEARGMKHERREKGREERKAMMG